MMSEGMMNLIYRSPSVVYISKHLDIHIIVYFHAEIV